MSTDPWAATNCVLDRHWHLGLTLGPDDCTDTQAVAAIARIPRGNLRLVERLFTQIDRVMKINGMQTIPVDVIEVARSTLVIGVSQNLAWVHPR